MILVLRYRGSISSSKPKRHIEEHTVVVVVVDIISCWSAEEPGTKQPKNRIDSNCTLHETGVTH